MFEFNAGEHRAYEHVLGAITVEEAAFEFEDKYERAGSPRMDDRYASSNEVYAAYQEEYALAG